MRRIRQQGLAVLCFSLFPMIAAAQTLQPQSSYHADGRIKQLWFPELPALAASMEGEARVEALIAAQAQALGLKAGVADLRLIEKRESLLGTHYRYQQIAQGRELESAQIIVTLLKDGRISQLYSTAVSPTLPLNTPRSMISLEAAYDAAWTWLGVRGQLLNAPRGELLYRSEGDALQLAYRIQLQTSEPYGVWEIHVDAASGKVLAISDRRIFHRGHASPLLSKPATLPAIDRSEAFAAYAARQMSLHGPTLSAAAGLALVFDPDPRSTLQRRDLEDESPALDFEAAYLPRPLQDIAFDGNAYRLDGPWVRVVDFDPPFTAPSETSDGNWNFKRGDNGFNDAMSYFHIDQNQRYLQELGYRDQTGLRFAPIDVDSDGVNGNDNSYFDPVAKRISFGHGCVDDNEDADVILHEYFHAIQDAINPNAVVGDTGAIGEGFSDYWAGSYSLAVAPSYYPNEMFNWDAHGNSNSCWAGRTLNATGARYDPSRTYPASVPIPGGYKSDELWSTPLFQSLLELNARGIPRQEVDRIIIEAQFGFGADLRMPEMAQSIVNTAQLLYAEGPHAEVFRQQFLRHGILVEPHPELSLRLLSLRDSGGNGVLDPGETIELRMEVSNEGTAPADSLQVELLSVDPKVEIVQPRLTLPGLAVGETLATLEDLVLTIKPEALCGETLDFSVTVSAPRAEQRTLAFNQRMGQAQNFNFRLTPGLTIPDGNQGGLLSQIPVSASGAISDQLKIGLDIRHSYRGDLRVTLIAPSGRRVLLHDRAGFSADHIVGTYPATLVPKESLSNLLGETRNGTWGLLVQDLALSDVGTLQSWSIEDTTAFICQ